MTERSQSRGGSVGDDVQHTDALAVQAEVLRTRHRDQQLGQFGGEQPDAEGILILPGAEPLVGHVDIRKEPVAPEQWHEFLPLGLRQIGTGRVVAGGVQQHHITGWQRLQRVAHGAKIDRAPGRLVIGVMAELQPGTRQQRHMIRPRRRADVHRGLRRGQTHQLRPQAQCPATTRALDRADPGGREDRVVGAENELFHGLVEGRIPGRGHIGLAHLALEDGLFGLADAVQNRGIPLGVPEYADAQIDLFRIGIGAEGRHQAKDRIIGDAVETLKHGCASMVGTGAQV